MQHKIEELIAFSLLHKFVARETCYGIKRCKTYDCANTSRHHVFQAVKIVAVIEME